MAKDPKDKNKNSAKKTIRAFSLFLFMLLFIAIVAAAVYFIGYAKVMALDYASTATSTPAVAQIWHPATLDKFQYNKRIVALANYSTSTSALAVSTATSSASIPGRLWPVKTVYPEGGAILPFYRIVAYYGNFYSTGMGVLGEYPVPQMLQMLNGVVAEWTAADPSTPVMPAIDYIAVTAQGSAGADGMYRLRMPADQIQKAVDIAKQVNGIVILDVQIGLSNVQTEVPLLAPFLKLPNVELALDPEFAMHNGEKPGTVIGTLDATDINWAANYLAGLVKQDNLPPKVLIVHRFTEDMVTHVNLIHPLPQVEMLMDMDGWGSPGKKTGTYNSAIFSEPVQFTGFKLFYKNDLTPPSTRMMTPEEILNLTPKPSFIQYQ